jgi:hypothetical protein
MQVPEALSGKRTHREALEFFVGSSNLCHDFPLSIELETTTLPLWHIDADRAAGEVPFIR